MEQEAGLHQSPLETKESSNETQPSPSDPAPSSSAAAPPSVTRSPPRLTPNPLLLDSPAATVTTPITCSPPPPLTPAPSLSASAHVTKSPTPTSPHLLVPAPPKLTSTATPALRTYGRPILPSPAKTQAPISAAVAATTTTATPAAASKTNSSTASATTSTSLATKTSSSLTNGSARTVATTTSTPITPFHTPASPPGRQVSQSLPVGSAALARANQSAAPARPRLSQQTLLLGKGLKGPGQDQVLLRAQMLILTSAMRPSSSSSSSASSTPASAQLQSLTLRPPPPGALTIPPSLRLKPPPSASGSSAPPPPLSRPQTSLFPPLRPRPITTATANSVTTTTTPSRHLSVPPPTLYSPVRAVPLRPRLLSPNGHRSPAPKQPLHPIAAAPPPSTTTTSSSTGPPSINRPLSGVKTCPLAPTMLSPGQPPTSSPCFERSPSAARQLQIIALSSGRQLQTVNAPPQKTAVSSESKNVHPLSPTLAKRSPPLSSPTAPKVDTKDKLQQDKKPNEVTVAKDLKVGTVDQREREKSKIPIEKGDVIAAKKPRIDEKDAMNVTERGQSGKKPDEEKKTPDVEMRDPPKKEAKDSKNDTRPRITEAKTLTSPLKSPPNASPKPIPNAAPVAIPVAAPVRTQMTTSAPGTAAAGGQSLSPPVPLVSPVSSPLPVPEGTANQSHPSRFNELHSANQDDNVSVQSDNQSALSSLSSQSPPCSPFVSPSADPPPPPPQPPERPTDLRLNNKPEQTTNGDTHNHEPHAEPHENLTQSEEEEAELEGFDQSERCPWEPRVWPEGQQVLTHLVEGFVIQEGLTPFPVNRSSLLVQDQVAKPQEVTNGTNGNAASPEIVTETRKQTEHSTDTEEEEEGGEANDHDTRPPHRDRTVLHCQFCGKRGHAHNFMRSKRFCSTSCARGFNVRLTKRLRALSAGSRSDRPRPVLNRAESVPGKPLLLRLPRDLWSAGRREKEVKEKPPPAAAAEEEEEEDMEVEAGAEEEDDGDDGPEEEEEEEEDEEEEEEEEEPAAMTTSPHSNSSLTHSNNSVPHNNNIINHSSSSSGGAMTQAEGAVPQRVQRRASAPAVTSTFRPSPSQWSVEEVTAFINALPGCGDVAEAFRSQEIDGQALLLLTEDHLMTSLNIKLGPALKICAHINSLKNQ